MNRAWYAIIPIALLPLLFHWMPLWRPNGIWFGVTVAPGYADGPDARRVLQRFRIAIWVLALAAAGMAVLGAPAQVPWALAAAVTLEIGGALAAFAYARSQTLPHAVRPDAVRSASLTAATERMPGGIFAVLVPFAILAAAAVYLYLNWDLLPQRFPVHWDVLGGPGWAERSWQSVFAPLLLGAVHAGFMFLIAFGILRASPRGRIAANAAANTQFRRVILQFLVAAVWGMALLVAAVALGPRSRDSIETLTPLAILGLLALTIPFLVRLVLIGRKFRAGGDGTPDQCWKLGFLYINPADPAIFVEKRLGIGYTCNFGNQTAWVFLGLILLFSLIPVLLRYL